MKIQHFLTRLKALLYMNNAKTPGRFSLTGVDNYEE